MSAIRTYTSAPMTETSSAQSHPSAALTHTSSESIPAAAPPTSSVLAATGAGAGLTLALGDISSPQQLVDWVDTALSHLETRFDDMNAQVSARMNEMSNRIDALETSIQGLIHGSIAPIAQD